MRCCCCMHSYTMRFETRYSTCADNNTISFMRRGKLRMLDMHVYVVGTCHPQLQTSAAPSAVRYIMTQRCNVRVHVKYVTFFYIITQPANYGDSNLLVEYAVVTFQVYALELSAIVHSILSEDTRLRKHATEIPLCLSLTRKLP